MNESNDLNEHFFEIDTRLSFYEFLLEVLHANLFHNMPDPKAGLDAFGRDLLDRIQKGYPQGSPSPLDDRMIERMREIADHFVYKVSRRLDTMP
jgi:hypothetical protein